MKSILILIAFLFQVNSYAQKEITICFKNDYLDVYHLSLIIYTPDGKSQTRVGDLTPNQVKTYSFPEGTEIYVADWKQEAFAMKGNDIKATGVKPTFVLTNNEDNIIMALSFLNKVKAASKE